MYFLERFGFLADGDGDGAHADRTAAIIFRHDAEHAFVHFVEPSGIDLQKLERGSGDRPGDFAFGTLLRKIADEVYQVIGDTRGATRARGDFAGAPCVDDNFEQTATAFDDAL